MPEPRVPLRPDRPSRLLLAVLRRQNARRRRGPQGAPVSMDVLRRAMDRPCFPQALSSLGVRRVIHLRVPGETGLRPARLYLPYGKVKGAILFLHGGGFVHCGLNSHHGVCARLARQSGAAVLSYDYRLAPEHRFPAAIDDSWAALRWLAGEAWRWGGGLAVVGDSAGGNIAAVLAHRARDRGGPALCLQLLYYPSLFGARDVPSHIEMAEGYMLSVRLLRWYAEQYVRAPDDLLDPELAPIEAARFDGLAPAVIITAQFDPLRDEGAGYAARLRDAGTAVRYECIEGAIHGFLNFYSFMPRARRAIARGARELRAAFAAQ